jgi:hypothetical protein
MKSETEVTDDFEIHIAENRHGYVGPDLVGETARPIAEPDFIETFAAEAGPTIAGLKGLGVRFDFLPTRFLAKSQPRLLPVGGGLPWSKRSPRAPSVQCHILLRDDGHAARRSVSTSSIARPE